MEDVIGNLAAHKIPVPVFAEMTPLLIARIIVAAIVLVFGLLATQQASKQARQLLRHDLGLGLWATLPAGFLIWLLFCLWTPDPDTTAILLGLATGGLYAAYRSVLPKPKLWCLTGWTAYALAMNGLLSIILPFGALFDLDWIS